VREKGQEFELIEGRRRGDKVGGKRKKKGQGLDPPPPKEVCLPEEDLDCSKTTGGGTKVGERKKGYFWEKILWQSGTGGGQECPLHS